MMKFDHFQNKEIIHGEFHENPLKTTAEDADTRSSFRMDKRTDRWTGGLDPFQ